MIDSNNIFSIKDRVIIITGSGRGIGKFIAEKMNKEGAIVYCIDLKFDEKIKKENYYQKKCNITDEKNLATIINQIMKKHKRIDVLINNAAVTYPQKNNKVSMLEWEKSLKVNLTGALICSLLVIKQMKERKKGSIINITSLNAERGFPKNPAYVASKGGLKMLTKSLAKDYGKFGIRVNNLGPGYIVTKMTEKSYKNRKNRIDRQKHTLLNRWGKMEDLLGPSIFLASDASGYVTGQDLYVDGGWLANGLIE